MHIQDWINPDHFTQADLFPVDGDVARKPRVWIVDDLLRPEKLMALREVFAIDELWSDQYGLFDRRPHRSSREDWEAATARNRFWHYRELDSNPRLSGLLVGWANWVLFSRAVLPHPAMMELLARRTGQPVPVAFECKAIALRRGHFQRPHKDSGTHRQLCGAFYVRDGWQRGYGGEFEMTVDGESVHRIEPKANRLILFDPHEQGVSRSGETNTSLHCMLPLNDKAGDWERFSVSVWWLNAEP